MVILKEKKVKHYIVNIEQDFTSEVMSKTPRGALSSQEILVVGGNTGTFISNFTSKVEVATIQ